MRLAGLRILMSAARVGLALACAAQAVDGQTRDGQVLHSQAGAVASLPAARRAARGGDFDCAIELYSDVLERHPDDREARKGRAQVLVWSTRYAEAEQDYRRILRSDPLDVEATTGLALTLLRENRFEESERLVRGILTALPSDPEARLLLGEVMLRTDRTEEARAEFERAASLEPANPRARLGTSRALAASGRDIEARAVDEGTAQALSQKLLGHPEEVEVRLAFATALVRLDRNEEALAQYEAVLRRDPGNVEAELGRAVVDLRLGRLDEARSRIRSLLFAHPNSAAAHALEGELFLRSRQAAEAELAFGVARDLDPWNTEYRIGVANSRAATSDVAGARAEAGEALCLDPWSHDVRELLSRLDAIEVPGRFRLDAGLRFDRLTGPVDDWSQETAHLAWKASTRLTLGAGIDGFQRFGEDDVQVVGDVAWRADDDWTLSSAYTYGPDAVVVARSAFDAEVARRVGRDASAILHWRHAMYVAGVRTDTFSPGIEFPCGENERLLLRYYLVDSSETGDGHAGSLRLELFPEGPLRTRVGVAYGSESFLADSVTQAIRTSDVLTVFAGVEWFCSKRTRLSLGYDYEDHHESPDKQGLALGITVEF